MTIPELNMNCAGTECRIVEGKQYQGIVMFVELSQCFMSSDAHLSSVVLVCILTSIANVTRIQHHIQRP